MLQTAAAWLVDGVRLKLSPAQAGEPAQIRIAFNANGGSWSYIGTDGLGIHPSQPTMNLGWATLETAEHDFCAWSSTNSATPSACCTSTTTPKPASSGTARPSMPTSKGRPTIGTGARIDYNVFARFDASNVITTDFDHASVMIYTIPARWTVDGKSFMPSWTLSAGDVATIRKLYA